MDSLINLSYADTLAILDSSYTDPIESAFSVIIPDTIKILDTANYLTHPSFYLSIVSLIIAFVALFFPLLSKTINKRKQTARFAKYVMHLLRELSNSIESRIPRITSFASNVRDIQSGSIEYESILLHPAKALSDIDLKNLYNIFINYKKPRNEINFTQYKSILDAIEYFVRHDEFGRMNFEKFFNDLRRYESNFKENIDSILRSFDKFVATNKRDEIPRSKDEFLRITDEIIYTWKSGDTPFHYLVSRDKLLIPLKQHAVANTTDERAIQILESIIKCNYALEDIINIRKVYGKAFDSVVSVMKKKKEALDNAIIHFKSMGV